MGEFLIRKRANGSRNVPSFPCMITQDLHIAAVPVGQAVAPQESQDGQEAVSEDHRQGTGHRWIQQPNGQGVQPRRDTVATGPLKGAITTDSHRFVKWPARPASRGKMRPPTNSKPTSNECAINDGGKVDGQVTNW